MNGLKQEAGTMAGAKAHSTPLNEATNLIEKEICHLRETVTELEGRLTPLLVDQQPSGGAQTETTQPAKSPLLMFMDDTERAIRTQRCRLKNLLERLQV